MHRTWKSLSILFQEVKSLCRAVCDRLAGSLDDLSVNPTKLCPVQAQRPSLLFIHGDHSDPSIWRPMLEELNSLGMAKWTLQYHRIEDGHQALQVKLRQIREAHGGRARVILVGHSLGGLLALHYLEEGERLEGVEILGVLPIATRLRPDGPFRRFGWAKIENVLAHIARKSSDWGHRVRALSSQRDWMIGEMGHLPKATEVIPKTSHLSIVQAPETFRAVIRQVLWWARTPEAYA